MSRRRLQVMEDVKEKAWAWFKAWAKKPAQPRAENRALPLPFDRKLTHREWAQRAVQGCINPETA